GISLLIALLPGILLDFRGSNHQTFIQQLTGQLGDSGFAQMIGNALIEDRESMARADAWRSVIFILLATGLLWLWVKDKLKVNTVVIVLATLILIDMWVVNRRYLNKD